MKLRFYFIALLALLALTVQTNGQERPGSGRGTSSGGGGGVVSNAVNLTFALATRYTNTTAYYAEVSAGVNYSTASGLQARITFSLDTNVDGTTDFTRETAGLVGAATLTFIMPVKEMVPPGAAWAWTNNSSGGSVVSFVSSGGEITYFATNGSGGGSASSVGLANSIHVATNGSDVTGSGSLSSPFATPTNASVHAVAGQTVFVWPGTYVVETNVAKTGVNWHLYNGASFYRSNWNSANLSGFFDDRFGAVTMTLSGEGSFVNYEGPIPNYGSFQITNPSSVFILHGLTNAFSAYYYSGNFPCAAVHAKNGYVEASFDYWTNPNNGTTFTDPDDNTYDDAAIGVYWELGEMHINFKYFGKFSSYSLWPELPSYGANATANLWVKGNLLDGYVYVAGVTNNNNWRTWWDVLESTGGFTFYDCGRHYLKAEKIGDKYGASPLVLLQSASAQTNLEVWIHGDPKINYGISSSLPGVVLFGTNILHAPGLDIVCYTNAANAPEAVVVNNGATLDLRSSKITTPGLGLLHINGTSDLDGVHIVATGTKPPVFVAGSGLNLTGVRLKGPLATNSIAATNAQNVSALWSAGRNTNSSNVTLLIGNTNFIVSPNVN
jgi:hypothetical protein